MITIKLKLKQELPNELESYLVQYSSCFRKMYCNMDKFTDKVTGPTFKSYLLDNHDLLDSSILDSLKIQVSSKIKKVDLKRIDDMNELKELKAKTKFKYKKERYKTQQKIARLTYKLTNKKDIVFGGKSNLSKATYYKNIGDTEKYIKYLTEFKNNRLLNYCSVGRACEKSNRKFNFDFINNNVTFKPNRNNKYQLDYHAGKVQQKKLVKLQALIGVIPITVEFSLTHVYIIYDNELVNGYSFNNVSCAKEQRLTSDQAEKKTIYINWCREHESRQLKGKLVNRYAAVDLNPQHISLSIVDKINDTDEFNIIYKVSFNLTKLSKRLELKSTNPKQIKQNNKRKTEISIVWSTIFKLINHYKVSHFVMEDLDFKSDNSAIKAKEFNRITKNIWHRTLTTELINKWCLELGIKIIEVNPCYSSFIGNLCYRVFDPVAASLEIARRGLIKYTKGYSIFPKLTRIDNSTMSDVCYKDIVNWISLYKEYSLSKLRYRNKLTCSTYKGHVLQSYKSRVSLYNFV